MSQSDLITFYNFPITSANLLRVIDQFGDAGRELLTNEPWPGAVLETNPIYAKTSDLTTLSPEGRAKFNDDYSSKRNTEYRKQKDALMTFLLGRLSTDSYTSVSSDPLFRSARATADTLSIWKLIMKTHLCGTSLSDKTHTLYSLMTYTQSTKSYESYLLKFREKATLVMARGHFKDF